MELRVLRYFLAVAREENITKAAKQLHITQPTLSRQLMQLEDELGVVLFHRSKHHIVLTDDGMLLRRRAEEIVSLSDKAERELQKKEAPISGEIAIGCGETLANMKCLAEGIAAFHARYPDVTFDIYTGIADDVQEHMENGLVDFGMFIEPVDISVYNFLRMPCKEQWTVLMRRDHELSQKACISRDDLAGQTLIMAKRKSVRNVVENWLGDRYTSVHVGVTMNLSASNKTIFVEKKMGLAVGLEFELTSQDVCQRPLWPPILTECVLTWKKTTYLPPLMHQFIQFMKEFFAGYEPLRPGDDGVDL